MSRPADPHYIFFLDLLDLLRTLHCSCRSLPEPCITCAMVIEDALAALPPDIERPDVSRIPPVIDDGLCPDCKHYEHDGRCGFRESECASSCPCGEPNKGVTR